MSLDTAKKIVRFLIVASVIVAVFGIILASQHDPITSYVSLTALGLFLLSLLFQRLFCKCPFCGETITKGLFTATICPHCRRDLVTGIRKKGKGGKKTKHH